MYGINYLKCWFLKHSSILFYRSLERGMISMNLKTNLESGFAISMAYDLSSIDKDDGMVYAAIVLLGLYILIVFEVITLQNIY